jgi:Leucine-rich repeat (LRR) protein
MASNFIVESGKYGKRLVVTSEWNEGISHYILAHNIPELYLNYAKGWKGKDLSFLSGLSHLQAFSVIHWTIDDIYPVNNLHLLRSLEISTYCKTQINFEEFPHLERCALRWRKKAKSLFKQKSIKRLFIDGYSEKNTSAFSNLTELEYLTLSNAPIRSLQGLGKLHKLQYLGLHNLRKLESLSGIEDLRNLEELNVNGCSSLSSIGEIANFNQLRKLQLCDNKEIETLKPIENLKDLEWVLFYGTTNILDGDLALLTKLKKLENLSFQNRKHYSHKREDFSAYTNTPSS